MPGQVSVNQAQRLVLPKVSGDGVVMLVPQNLEPEVVGVGDIDAVVQSQ